MDPGSMFILGIVLIAAGMILLVGGEFVLGLWRKNMKRELE